MPIKIRPEKPADYSLIDVINDQAFNQPDEGLLIRALRKRKKFIPQLSLVAKVEDRLVGHILFTPIEIKSNDRSFGSLALAPMAVLPDYQNKGIGSALVTSGLSAAKKLGFRSVIVLGHPEYYPRFGFVPASQYSIRAPFEVPNEAFMALELVPDGLQGVSGIVVYPLAFSQV